MYPKTFLDKNKETRINELFEFLRFPSVSAKSENKKDVLACARWLADHLNKKVGIESKIMPTAGHPVVYGSKVSSPDKLTVLYYGHYDVQPPEPLGLWKTEPFNPIIDGDYIIARGSTDDKGQLLTHLKALEAYHATGTELPVNIKLLIEGEEESGAENLAKFVEENADMLKADIIVVSDGSQFDKDKPAVTYGLRGVTSVELKITGPDRDLHSGGFGGSVPNPVNVLARVIAAMHDDDGKVLVDGFYDDVMPISDWERKQFAKLPFDKKDYLKKVGCKGLHGEKGYSVYEQIWARPTLDVNGIMGGYQGEGGKTIIPSWALAKITMRLVPNQKADDICDKFEKFVKKVCPDYVECEVYKHGGAAAVVVPTEGPWLEASARAIKTGFGIEPVFTKEGGSIPIVGTFKNVLGVDTLLLGWGQNDDNAHSPNERFSVNDFHRGCYAGLALIEELAKVKV
ncbi:MAG: dipeptidase [candidate division Zixibacteria bacterium HGW-Zixibacteria-1]|nr:MAG: dipeptidase [candidate division Zixibacteria bacterium HGW-Zixibacteria-1]